MIVEQNLKIHYQGTKRSEQAVLQIKHRTVQKDEGR